MTFQPSATQDSENSLWQVANHFRHWVSQEMKRLDEQQRVPLRGDYLFVISGKPRFVVLIEPEGAWSGKIDQESKSFVQFEEPCPVGFDSATFDALLTGGARVTVQTDENTLKRLLLGTIKAKAAFLSGKVTISGDLPAFLKLVSLLKSRGVRPLGHTATAIEAHAHL